MSLFSDVALLAERVADSKLPPLSGSLCFWGHWFGKPNENPCTLISVSFNESNAELRIRFSGNELLSVFEPEKINIENGQMIIYQATKIRIEWPDVGKDGRLKNRMFYEFQRIGKKITGNSNIHWSSIDQTNLSVNTPAVLMINSLSWPESKK